MLFAELGLSAPVMQALADEGYTVPTPIQAKGIPPVLAGRDVLGCAQTGTGKTAAFALPIIERLTAAPVDKTRRGPVLPRALILAPTRELAVQIGESFRTYGRHTALRGTVIYGGVSQFHQEKALRNGVDVIVATPGRLMDLMEQKLVNLTEVRTFVLDEADRMLDMGFIDPIRRIAAALVKGPQRQTLLFSATMPKAIVHLAEALLHEPVRVTVTPVSSAAPKIEQTVYLVDREQKQGILRHLIGAQGVERAVVFTRTKHGADKVSRKLNMAGVVAEAIHGDKAQNQRARALDRFKTGRSKVLVATDVAARGLDVDGITHVFNFDIPNEPESYIHRIGRTGRAGATGVAIALCDRSERGYLRDIERLTGQKLPVSHITHDQRAVIETEQAAVTAREHAVTSQPHVRGAAPAPTGAGHGEGRRPDPRRWPNASEVKPKKPHRKGPRPPQPGQPGFNAHHSRPDAGDHAQTPRPHSHTGQPGHAHPNHKRPGMNAWRSKKGR